MKRGFYTIMAAQFCSSLADNALFVAAVELLRGALIHRKASIAHGTWSMGGLRSPGAATA